MKIGFFGNTNNYPLMLAEAFRKLGHEVLMVLAQAEPLHRPESRYAEFQTGYPDWIIDASHLTDSDFIRLDSRIAPVLKVLASCDALVLNYVGPSLLPMLRRPAIAQLTGSDLDYYANPTMLSARTACWTPSYTLSAEGQKELRTLMDFIKRQRDGIRDAVAVRCLPRGLVPVGDKILDEIGVTDEKRFFMPTAGLERIELNPAPRNLPVRVFCATRLTWKHPIQPGQSTLDYKGSDIMVRGLGLFYRETKTQLDIQLVRKGLHVAELEALIAEEGLTDQVTWSNEMSLTQVWAEFGRCDIVIEQLANSMIGMAGWDAMASGRPVIGNLQPEVFAEFKEAAPVCQAKTPEEVAAWLNQLVFNPEERERLGRSGRRYAEAYLSSLSVAQTCLQYLRPHPGKTAVTPDAAGLMTLS
jgi:hypothetical protein